MGNEKWTKDDRDSAAMEGWNLFDSDGEVRIERGDESRLLPDDRAAWLLVVGRAKSGSPLHQKALRMISQEERERIRKVAHVQG